MKTAFWDIECWDLSPQFGPIICASVLDAGTGEMTTFRIDKYIKKGLAEDMTDDKQLCIDVRDYLETFHCTSGWFSKGFDMSFLRTRLVMHGERPLKEHLHLDCIWYYKGWRFLKPMSSKMKHVAEFLKLERKPDVAPDVWMAAKGGNKKALDEVVDRCEADVRITQQITDKSFDLGLVRTINRY
jgi:uncharacterized protein YprB with RNaseH-like and TPR domain